jgi:predicted nucleic acid-binding protein
MVALDTSALLRHTIDAPGSDLVHTTLASAEYWAISALARAEALSLTTRMASNAAEHGRIEATLRSRIDRFHIVPVDERILAAATDIAATYRVRIADAIHLASAARLPAPVRYLTFDRRQLSPAVALGFHVVAPREPLSRR